MKLPRPSEAYDVRIESQRNLFIEQADDDNHKKRQDVEVGDARLILKAPNGTRYSVTVDNSGNLAAASI
tara:strand:- start:1279 stop:1485 length:207 start_codon:yes stop_codon:yes gene_type:complete